MTTLAPFPTGQTAVPAPAASPLEQALAFPLGADTLLGVLHRPAAPGATASVGVVVVVGGPQVRAGSHRQFLHLARHLAAAGHPVLRFDVRGMGDSTGAPRSFEQLTPDIGAAIAALQRAQPQVQRVVLWGLCDGASAALLYLDETADPRVAGLGLANPWVRSAHSLARTQVRHYYTRRLLQRSFWAKLLRGQIAGRAWQGFVTALRGARQAPAATPAAPGFVQRMAAAWRAFPGPVLLLLSEHDYTAKEFLDTAARDAAWQGALQRPALARHDLPGTDHTFSTAARRLAVAQATAAWLGTWAESGEAAEAADGAAPAGARAQR